MTGPLAETGVAALDPPKLVRVAAEARRRAEALYADGDLFCSEAVVKTVNDLTGHTFPDEITRLATPLAIGMGESGCSCGGLTGATMALGILCGRDKGDQDWETPTRAARELHRRFSAEFGGACCRGIVRRFGGMDGAGRHEHCAELTGRCAALVFEVASDLGIPLARTADSRP